MSNVLNYIKTNFKWILITVIGIYLFYWIVFVLTPITKMSVEQKQILDSLSIKIEDLHKINSKLEDDIDFYNEKITEVDNNIDKIKNQKTIIKEIYHEKISGVDKLTVAELDSFFSKRYNY